MTVFLLEEDIFIVFPISGTVLPNPTLPCFPLFCSVLSSSDSNNSRSGGGGDGARGHAALPHSDLAVCCLFLLLLLLFLRFLPHHRLLPLRLSRQTPEQDKGSTWPLCALAYLHRLIECVSVRRLFYFLLFFFAVHGCLHLADLLSYCPLVIL